MNFSTKNKQNFTNTLRNFKCYDLEKTLIPEVLFSDDFSNSFVQQCERVWSILPNWSIMQIGRWQQRKISICKHVCTFSIPWYCMVDQTKEYFLHPNCWILLWWTQQARLFFSIDLSKAKHVRFSSQMALLRGSLSDPLSLRLCLNFGSIKYRLIKTLRVIWMLSEKCSSWNPLWHNCNVSESW